MLWILYYLGHTWFDLDAIIVVIVIICALLNVIGRERRVAGPHSTTLGFSLARLNAVLLHSRRPVDAMQLVIETTGVAYRFTH